MKPMSPEDRDLEKMSSEISERYRAVVQDEPPAQLDAAVLAASRREVERPRQPMRWQIPASFAAMLVIGVSLVLLVRDNEPPLSSFDGPAAEEAKLAKPEPPQLALKVQPMQRADSQREARPSRERSERPGHSPLARDETAAAQENAVSAAAAPAPSAPAPTVPYLAGTAKSDELEQSRIAESSAVRSSKKAGAMADAASESLSGPEALRKGEAAVPARDWLEKIDVLLRDGKEVEARRQLLVFRKEYPRHPLPERLQALLPPD